MTTETVPDAHPAAQFEPVAHGDLRWVGRRVQRVEDAYLLTGRGEFLDDLEPRGTLHFAFVRSAVPSARIASLNASAALAMPGVVACFDASDLGNLGLRTALERPDFVATEMPALARDRIRHVGEAIAVVVATSPYAAEDGAEAVVVEYDELPAVASVDAALAEGAPLVHDEAPGNLLLDASMSFGDDIDAMFESAAHLVEAEIATGRLSALPLEGRGVLAAYDERSSRVILESSTQVPHLVRTGVAEALGIEESHVQVVVPDVGGGFGQKCVVAREEVVAAALCRRLRRRVKWVEDRREGLISGFQSREQHFKLRGAFDADATLLALEAEIWCDVGAYSCYPFSCAVEVLMAANELPGPYRLQRYRVRSRGVATNKTPIAPYRGVSRPQAVLAMERLMEVAADQIGIDRLELRHRNMISRDEFPYRNVVGALYDPGSYRESLTVCAGLFDEKEVAELRREAQVRGKLLGLGFACFVEPTAYGTASFAARKMTIVPGYEQATVRMDASGSVVVMVGTLSHGQGHATTYAQIVAERLGIDLARVRMVQGDTTAVPHGWGTFASRSLVAAGGALARASDDLASILRRIAGHVLEAAPADIELSDGRASVRGTPSAGVAIDELARVAHYRANTLPPDLGRGLEVIATFDPEGTYSNATHAALVELDPETGMVTIRRFAVVEDCGVMINPMIVDGQVAGGVTQGIGSALFEEFVYDETGQPLSGSLMDYLAPTATDVPRIEIHHLETPTDRTPLGAKGMGEGGAIGSPSAILNAVNDALRGLGAVARTPIRPEDVVAAIAGTALEPPRADAAGSRDLSLQVRPGGAT
jgi:carbon-monoxide dehydrogenase large subunit